MSNFLLILALLMPQLGWCQLFGNPFQPGFFALAASPGQRQPGQLKLQGGRLLVKTTAGQELRLKPAEVGSFRIGPQAYTVLHNIQVREGIGTATLSHTFAEQLDSGQVQLLRVEFSFGGGIVTASSGADGSYSGSAYVLRQGPAGPPVTVQAGAYSSGGKKFREVVRPFFVTRPELQKLLEEKRINTDNLAAAIRALNTGAPFNPPAALNLE